MLRNQSTKYKEEAESKTYIFGLQELTGRRGRKEPIIHRPTEEPFVGKTRSLGHSAQRQQV